MKYVCAVIVALVASLAFTVNAMAGDENDKVFVCKYVGTPGVDETLQTGQNPISVSINAIPDFPGIGGFFADAQGRSLVIAFDTGQGEEGLSCPGGEGCPEGQDCNPQPDVFAATATCNESTGEFDVGGTVNGLAALVSILHIAGSVNGDTTITVTLGDKVKDVIVHTTGDCGGAGPPRSIPELGVSCDQANSQWVLTGTIDDEAAITVPATIPGNKDGFTIVTVSLGDVSQQFLIQTDGTCVKPPVVLPPCVSTGSGQDGNIPANGNTNDNCQPLDKPTPPIVTPMGPTVTPAAVTTPATPAKPVIPAKPAKPVVKPKPKAKPKPAPKTPTVHICKPYKDGTQRVWVKGMGCHVVLPPEPKKLTG